MSRLRPWRSQLLPRWERGPAPWRLRLLLPFLAIAITLLLATLLIAASGANPLEVFYEMLITPFTRRTSRLEILVRVTPLLLTGIAVAIAFRAGYYNIGAEGQLYAGAMAAAFLGPRLGEWAQPAAISVMLAGGLAAGAAWALVPALLKVYAKVDEVVTTLLLNSVMLLLVSGLLNGPWRDPISGWPRSPTIADAAVFPQVIARSRVHLGFVVALVIVAIFWWVLARTRFGLEMRAVGLGATAARFMGVNVRSTVLVAALLSGAVAGVAGVSEVAGIHGYLIEGLSPEYGYTGIIVATFGGLHALGVTAAASFLALIDIGSTSAARELGIPAYLGNVVQAVLLLVTLAVLLLGRYRPVRRRGSGGHSATDAGQPPTGGRSSSDAAMPPAGGHSAASAPAPPARGTREPI
ncbi:MAG TPA: ABC transporter permease [Trueperaceae bacterium]|nr:ABC transporter permease [Trueperaceae bacterium]